MRNLIRLLPLLLFGAASCNFPIPMAVVSIRPMYGWVDGCTAVKVGGHGFGDDAQVLLGGTALTDLTFPDPEAESLDVGYVLYGVTPPKSDGQPGWVDLTVETGGTSSTVAGIYYYQACPGAPWPEALSVTEGVTAGTAISVTGCSLDAAAYTVKVGDSDPVPLSSVCGTAQVTFAAPQQDEGTWFLGFFDSAGIQVYPDPACDITVPVGDYVPPVDADTSDTAAPWDPCSGAVTLTYGGAA